MPLFDPSAACSAVSLQLHEPLVGTAKVATGWLVVEQPGSWGPRGLADVTDWPDEVRDEVLRRAEALDVAVQLVRRPGRHAGHTGRTVHLVHSGEDGSGWVRTLVVDDVTQLLELDLAGTLRTSPDRVRGVDATADGLWLVCTHGRRDACCARLGRPVAAALVDRVPGEVWETTHTGGHRFAANLIHLPTGVTYARVEPEGVAALAGRLVDGELALASYRGRSSFTRPVQAAEIFLRRALDLTALDAVTFRGAAETWDGHRFVFTTRQRGEVTNFHVEVEQRPTGMPRPLSSGDHDLQDPGAWHLVRLEEVR